MAAIVGYVFGESFTEPEIAELMVSEDENLVYIRKAGAVGFDGIESLDDLRENRNRLLDAAGNRNLIRLRRRHQITERRFDSAPRLGGVCSS